MAADRATDRVRFVEFSIEAGDGWVRLPIDAGVDPQAWAVADVDQASVGVEPNEFTIGHAAAAAQLAAAAARAQEFGASGVFAPLALAFQPNPLGEVFVYLDVAAFPWEDEGPLTLTEIAENLGVGGASVGESEHTTTTLALGPAARVRRMFADSPDGGPDYEEGDFVEAADVVEGITYIALPPGLPGFVWVNAQWRHLVLGDELATQVDALVETLKIEFSQ